MLKDDRDSRCGMRAAAGRRRTPGGNGLRCRITGSRRPHAGTRCERSGGHGVLGAAYVHSHVRSSCNRFLGHLLLGWKSAHVDSADSFPDPPRRRLRGDGRDGRWAAGRHLESWNRMGLRGSLVCAAAHMPCRGRLRNDHEPPPSNKRLSQSAIRPDRLEGRGGVGPTVGRSPVGDGSGRSPPSPLSHPKGARHLFTIPANVV